MIAGLPWQSWLLLIAAIGIGLAVELAFFAAHRRRSDRTRDESGGQDT